MRIKMMMIAVSLGVTAMSCGETTEAAEDAKAPETAEAKAKAEAVVKEKAELGNKLNELNLEIEAIDAADAEVDAMMSELDNI